MESKARKRIDWVRITVEGVLIVSSILLAFAIDAWWDGRQEGLEEQRLLRYLQGDFIASREIRNEAATSHFERRETAFELFRFGRSNNASVPEDLTEKTRQTFLLHRTFHPRTGSLDGALATGKLDLISNDSLRSRLAGWPRMLREYTEQEEFIWDLVLEARPVLAASVPIGNNLYAASRLRSEEVDSATVEAVAIDGIVRFLRSDTAQHYAALRGDAENFAFNDATDLVAWVEEVLSLIESEIH